jgi:4-amino-4-deoxy-L-arabinose transferase-like glycosyltransferase
MSNSENLDSLVAKKSKHDKLFLIIVIIVLAALSVLLQIKWSPANHKISVDGAVFAYGGARILDGDLPYRDFWDHKPPGVFYLNALAFWLWGGDAWGVWYLAVVWTFAIAMSFYWFLKALVPRAFALFCSIVLLATFLQADYYEGTNMTEFYGLLPTILALYLTYYYLASNRKIALIGIGGTFIAGFLFKQTTIATALACITIIFYVDIRRKGFRRAIKGILLIAVVPVLVLLSILLYWGLNGALLDLWQATVEYNLSYAQASSGLRALYGSLRTLAANQSLQPLFILALGAGFALWVSRRSWKNLKRSETDQGLAELAVEWTYVTCFVALLAEVLILSIQGRGFGHYYVTLFPALCATASYWFRYFLPVKDGSSVWEGLQGTLRALLLAVVFVWVVVVFGIIRPTSDEINAFMENAPIRKPLRTDVGKYINSHTNPDDTVLYWNVGAEVNFETGRRSPSRYFYFQPLFQPGFQNAQRWSEFIDDIKTNRPVLLITMNNAGYAPMFDMPSEELASSCNCGGEILAGFKDFSDYVKANYDKELILNDSFVAYHLKNP